MAEGVNKKLVLFSAGFTLAGLMGALIIQAQQKRAKFYYKQLRGSAEIINLVGPYLDPLLPEDKLERINQILVDINFRTMTVGLE